MSRIILFLGSARDSRNGERVARHLVRLLEEKKHSVTVFDPLKLPFELPAQPLQLLRGDAAPGWFRDARRSVAAADGFVVVTPEYFGSPSPVLINMLNHFPMASYRHRPVGIACYSISPYGGLRAAAITRPHLSELGLVSVPAQLTVPTVTQSYSTEGEPLNERVQKSADRLVTELTWYVQALKAARQGGEPG